MSSFAAACLAEINASSAHRLHAAALVVPSANRE
jgi:hypothetical protein